MIQFKDVTFTYGETKLFDHFNYEIKSGEHVCIAGKSGAGKSTLLNMILGFVAPDSGAIKVNEQDVTPENLQHIRSQILFLPQDINLPFQTVRELLQFPYTLKVNRKSRFDEKLTFQLFEQLGLNPALLEHSMSQISGGQKQRIALISGLLTGKKLLLLDEPTAALDPESTTLMGQYLQGLTDTTIFAISHDERFASFFDRTLIL